MPVYVVMYMKSYNLLSRMHTFTFLHFFRYAICYFEMAFVVMQELRSREEELQRVSLQQRIQEEALRRREHELAEREIQLVERELNVMILQQVIGKPIPKQRCGKFRKSRLKLLKAGGCRNISAPSGTVCVLTFHSVFDLFGDISSAGQNTHQKVFEILNTKYFLKSISNTKIPNTF